MFKEPVSIYKNEAKLEDIEIVCSNEESFDHFKDIDYKGKTIAFHEYRCENTKYIIKELKRVDKINRTIILIGRML